MKIFCLLLSFFCYFNTQSTYAKPHGHTPSASQTSNLNNATLTFIDYLTKEKAHLSDAIDEIHHKVAPVDEKDFNQQIEQCSLIIKMIRVKIESLQGFIDQQNKEQIALNQRLKNLQQLPFLKEGKSIQERVAKVEALITTNRETLQLINETLNLARNYHEVLQDHVQQLQEWHFHFSLEQKLKVIAQSKEKLNQELNRLFHDSIGDQTGKKSALIVAVDSNNEAKLLINNQHISALQHYISALNVQKKVIKADISYLKNPNTKNLQLIADIYHDALNQYIFLEQSLTDIRSFLENETHLVKTANFKFTVQNLQKSIKSHLTEMDLQKATISQNLINYQNQLKQLISSRQSLSDYGISSWPFILKKIAAIPDLFIKYAKNLGLKVYDSYSWLSTSALLLFWSGCLILVMLFCSLAYFLKSLQLDKERSSFTGYFYDGLLTILHRNIPYLCMISLMMFVFYMTHISFSNYQLLLHILVIGVTFRIVTLIARLVLLERISDSSGTDVKLYHRLKWLLLFGGWTTALMSVGHLLPLSILLQDLFNRLFMLFMLTVSLVAWRSKEVVRYLIRPLLTHKKRYVYNAISLVIFLVPLTLFSTAVIGLMGFTNLAWTMSQYQADALLILVAYILIRGFLFDALELFSKWMISSLKNGWLWTEVFLKPIDRILRVILLIACCLALTHMYGWNSDSVVMINLSKLVQYPIVNLPGIHITIMSTAAFISLLFLFIWAAKWTREFCFRWLYQNIKDAGVRHSVSVFSQYAVVLVGTVVTLHVLGFDFSGMSMIIGGLAVGLGFGLRDFASNIVGGIMLLIERPVREGDLVTIGEHEGRVAHIGIRCMRVSSWDNMEVLIPNSETFNKPFTNWTHQDSIVRSVVPIKVSRADDPIMIQQLILDVLAIIPEIVPDPPVQVCLKKIDAGLIEFEARYFINVQLHSRFEVQSKVLFAITAQFKAANIKPPIEPIAVEFKEKHAGFVAKKESTPN